MKYSNQLLENKMFKIIKEIVYNIALAICIMLVGVLIIVYGFKFKLNNVLSDSQYPYFKAGDMVIIKEQSEYVEGDIVKFYDSNGTPVAHRLVCIYSTGGQTYYICHGDNNQSIMYERVPGSQYYSYWEDEAEYIEKQLMAGELTINELKDEDEVQVISASQIEGKVINHLNGMGYAVDYIKNHAALLAALVAAVWCVTAVSQNEIEIKRSLRLF